MATAEKYDDLVLGSGEAGKYIAWTLAKAGRRVVVVERELVGTTSTDASTEENSNVDRPWQQQNVRGRQWRS